MGVWMRAVLMDRDDVIEMPLLGLEEPLGDLRRDVAHVLPPGPDWVGKKHMGRLSKLRFEPSTPPLRKAFRQLLDLLIVELCLAIEEPRTVDDMGGLCREISELVRELGFGMCAPTPDRFEDGRTMPCSRPDQLPLFGDMEPLHRAPDAAPSVPENLTSHVVDSIIQPHGRTPSRRLLPPAALRLGGDERADRSHRRCPE